VNWSFAISSEKQRCLADVINLLGGGPDSILGRSVYSHLSLGPHLAYDVSDSLER